MSARRLGRLLGSVLILAAMVGGAFAVEAGQIQSSGYEWGAGEPSGYEWGTSSVSDTGAGDEDQTGYEWG